MSIFKNSPLTALLKSILLSYSITMLIFIIYALLITYTDISSDYISPLSLFVTSISCVICGFATAKSAKSKGLMWGAISALCYMLIMFTLGYTTIPTYELNQKFAISLILALIGGCVGGIFGVNKGTKK